MQRAMSRTLAAGRCSLVDAMRSGELTPLDALEASLKAIETRK